MVSVNWLPQSWLPSTHRWSGCLSWQLRGESCRWILLPWPHTDKQHTNRQGTRHFYLGTQHAPGTITRRFSFQIWKFCQSQRPNIPCLDGCSWYPNSSQRAILPFRRPPHDGTCWGGATPKGSLWDMESSSQRLGLYCTSTNVGDIVSLILEARKLNHITKDEVPCHKPHPEAAEPHLNSNLSNYKFLTLSISPSSILLKATRLQAPT